MAKRRNSALDFIQAFNAAYDTVNKVGQDYEMSKVANAKPEQAEGFTAEQGEQIRAAADSGQSHIGYDEANKAYVATPKLADGQMGPAQSVEIAKQGVVATNFLGERHAGSMTSRQVNAAKLAARAGVLEKYGDLTGAMKLRAAADSAALVERELADDAALRSALSGGGAPAVRNEDLRSSISTGADITGASNVLEHTPAPSIAMATGGQNGQAVTSKTKVQGFDNYLNSVAPNVLKTLVSQGKLDQAKRFQSFVDSHDGQAYAGAWVNGVRRLSVGDAKGALAVFEGLYNRQFHDGNTITMRPVEGKPDHFNVEMFDAQGKSLGSKAAPMADLAKTAALYLEPTRAVEFMAQQQGKRDAEAATLERQTQLESIRQTGREAAEDRRDERLAMRLQAQQDGLERRLAARTSGSSAGAKPLTAVQQRGNFEIDAAREIMRGLDPREIQRRTAKTTDTGRENPDYDPGLARAASLATRRKIGDDDEFDTRQRAPAPQIAPGYDRKDVANRFRSDKTMNANKLGKDTANGVEVLDSKGKLLGYYN